MMSDTYVETLNEMIQLLLDYKPGSRTLYNVIKLCQTLGLESFVDQVDNTKSRLSIASKIVVIDIDYEKEMEHILDVKLVLASNFDKFNYFNEKGENILLRSLSDSNNLNAFHHNLNFLVFLDSYSSVDLESGNTRLDLFKYYTDFPRQLKQFLEDQSMPYEVKANENDTFQITISDSTARIATILMQHSKNADKPVYEYVYKDKLKEWVNESSESATQGVCILAEFEDPIPFPECWLTADQVLDPDSKKFDIPHHSQFIDSVRVHTVFSSDLIYLKKFSISNDSITLLPDFLKWYSWYNIVIKPIFSLITKESCLKTNQQQQQQQPKMRRRSSVLSTRRPSLSDSTILRDSGVPQLTLKEIMDREVVDDSTDAMDIDVPKDAVLNLVVNEEFIYLNDTEKSSFNEDKGKWHEFINSLESKLK